MGGWDNFIPQNSYADIKRDGVSFGEVVLLGLLHSLRRPKHILSVLKRNTPRE